MKKGFLNNASAKKSNGNSLGPLGDVRSLGPTNGWGSKPESMGREKERNRIKREALAMASSRSDYNTEETFQRPRAMGAPKMALTNFYQRSYPGPTPTRKQYFAWHSGPPHKRRFTAVYVCPLSGEVWPCGRYGDYPEHYNVEPHEETGFPVVWWTKKTNAEHGAAARAHDCLSLRQVAGTDDLPFRIAEEEPYMSAMDAPPLLWETIPSDIQDKINNVREENKQERMEVEIAKAEEEAIRKENEETEQEAQQYRDTYRAGRTSHDQEENADATAMEVEETMELA